MLSQFSKFSKFPKFQHAKISHWCPIMLQTHMGSGPYGFVPTWALAHMAQSPYEQHMDVKQIKTSTKHTTHTKP